MLVVPGLNVASGTSFVAVVGVCWVHEAREHVLGVELHGVAVVAGELAVERVARRRARRRLQLRRAARRQGRAHGLVKPNTTPTRDETRPTRDVQAGRTSILAFTRDYQKPGRLYYTLDLRYSTPAKGIGRAQPRVRRLAPVHAPRCTDEGDQRAKAGETSA